MSGLMSVELNNFNEIIVEMSLDESYGTVEFVQAAEIYLALAVDACKDVKNFAGAAFETSDGRVVVVEARYEDGIPQEMAFSLIKKQKQALYDALAAICVKPEGFCCCLNQEQVDAGHVGECKEAQAALALAEKAFDWQEAE